MVQALYQADVLRHPDSMGLLDDLAEEIALQGPPPSAKAQAEAHALSVAVSESVVGDGHGPALHVLGSKRLVILALPRRVRIDPLFKGRARDARRGEPLDPQFRVADPTPALDLVAERVLRPRLEYVASIVAEIVGRPPDDDVVKRCVLSVQSQVHAAMPNYLARHLLPELRDPAVLNDLAEHIASFSIAGLHDVARRLRAEDRAASLPTAARGQAGR